MTGLHMYDDRNHVFLSRLYIPRAWPHSAELLDHLKASGSAAGVPDDDSVGTLLMRLAKARTAIHLNGTGREIDDAGLQSWIFGPSVRSRGALDSWFREARPADRFRLLFHRTPRRYGGRSLPGIWDDVGAEYSRIVPSSTSRDEMPLESLQRALPVLDQCLTAYARGTEAVVSWADSLEHPYTIIV